ncbi:hypothetical protein H0H87_008668 [Tephrocybe sp. NHM501043]|nr:hypothetical protein H0H87_008668 [Tephrocybe sp. NHM501043]
MSFDKKLLRRKDARTYNLDPRFFQFSGGETKWESSTLALEHGLGHLDPIYVDEELTLSKAFSASMKPSKIIPYFYRASGRFEQDDITITTLVTSSRFGAFSQLIERYQGPISVTIHVGNTTSEIRTVLRSLKSLHSISRTMAIYVDVHLVIDSFDRQFNTWRNIARLFARTDYIMMLDVDFYLCTDFRTFIRKSQHVMEKLRGGNAALVVPAFEYTKYSDGLYPSAFPQDKRRKHNRKLFSEFKEEICLRSLSHIILYPRIVTHPIYRYLQMFQDYGSLNTAQSMNALQECKNRKRNAKSVNASFFGIPLDTTSLDISDSK